MGCGAWGVTSMIIRPEKGLRSVPSVLCSFSLNDILLNFVVIILINEFYPLMIYRACFRWLKKPPFPFLFHHLYVDPTESLVHDIIISTFWLLF